METYFREDAPFHGAAMDISISPEAAEFLVAHAEETKADDVSTESEEVSALPETEPDAADDTSESDDPMNEVIADITEEDEAGGNFDDQALQDHRKTDEMRL